MMDTNSCLMSGNLSYKYILPWKLQGYHYLLRYSDSMEAPDEDLCNVIKPIEWISNIT